MKLKYICIFFLSLSGSFGFQRGNFITKISLSFYWTAVNWSSFVWFISVKHDNLLSIYCTYKDLGLQITVISKQCKWKSNKIGRKIVNDNSCKSYPVMKFSQRPNNHTILWFMPYWITPSADVISFGIEFILIIYQ